MTYDIWVSDNWDEKLSVLLENIQDPVRLQHMEKLADAFFDYLQRDNVEYGAWGVDAKRPFGNSYVNLDIAEIIDIELDYDAMDYQDKVDYIDSLYDDLGVFLRYKWLQFRNK